MSCITKDRKKMYLGCFEDEGEAAESYNRKAMELFKEYVCINIVER